MGPPQRGVKTARIGDWLVDARVPESALMCLSIIFAALAATCGVIAGTQAQEDLGQWFLSSWGWILGVPVFTALSPALAWLRELKMEAVHAAAEVARQAQDDYEESRLTQFRSAVLGAFNPVATLLSQIAASSPEKRQSLEGRICQAAVEAIPRVLGTGDSNRNRASFYRLSNGELNYETHAGRNWNDPRPKFDRGTRSGKKVLGLVEALDAVLIPDIAEVPAVNPTVPNSYRCVISCSVFAGEHPLGMLTVDAPNVDELTTDDEMLMKVLARLLGAALYKTERDVIPSKASDTVPSNAPSEPA